MSHDFPEQFRLEKNRENNTNALLKKCNDIYYSFLQKYANSIHRMSDIDKGAFLRRLYTMAKRQVLPYGDDLQKPTEPEEPKIPILEPLRIRATRILPDVNKKS